MSTDVTVVSGRVLPPICALTGAENASVRRDVVLGETPPPWMLVLLFLSPVAFLAVQMLRSKRTKLSYFLTPESNAIILGRQRLILFGSLIGIAAFLTGFALVNLWLLVFASLVLAVTFSYNSRKGEPFYVLKLHESSATLRGLHPALIECLQKEVAKRSADGKPMKPVYTPLAPVPQPQHSA